MTMSSFALFFSILGLFAIPLHSFSTLSFLSSTKNQKNVKNIGVKLYYTRDSYAYLADSGQKQYLQQVLLRSVDQTKACMAANLTLIEVAFPESRKNDISVTESLDINRAFSFEFACVLSKTFSYSKEDFWVLFPDKGEATLGIKSWEKSTDTSTPFTLASLDTACKTLQRTKESFPKMMISINPGFNVEEWILLSDMAELIKKQSPETSIIVVNGNLDRLRNGYYPPFFYPKLTKVTNSFYRKFSPAFCLSAVAVGGDRLGAWLSKQYEGEWDLIVKNKELQSYEIIEQYANEPDPKTAWRLAKGRYAEQYGGRFGL